MPCFGWLRPRRSAASFQAVLLVCGLAVGVVTPAQAVRLVTGTDYAPWVDESLPEYGVATAMVRNIFERISADPVTIDIKPWRRGLHEAQQGRYDATFPYGRTPEREAHFLYSDPLFTVRHVLFSRAQDAAFSSVESLKGKVICRPQGYAMRVLKELADRVSFSVERPVDIGGCFRMLALGRVDVVLTSEFVGWHELQTSTSLSPKSVKSDVLAELADEVTVHLIAPKAQRGSAQLIERFNEGLRLYEAEGLKRDLFAQRFGGKSY